MKNHLQLFKNGKEVVDYKHYNSLRDLFVDATGEALTDNQIDDKISELDVSDQLFGMMVGWGDTEFREKLYKKYKKSL
jgi:hypothetical protein